MTDKPDALAEYGPPMPMAPELPALPRNKTPTAKYIAYERPGSDRTHTLRPAPSSRRHGETEDDWVERTKARCVPADAINVRVLSD